jgi:hypothetical protein
MGPMCAHHNVALFQGGTYPYSYGFLSNAEMDRAAHFLLGVTLRDRLLDHTDSYHGEE